MPRPGSSWSCSERQQDPVRSPSPCRRSPAPARQQDPFPLQILPGDQLIVEQCPTAENGEIVVALLDDSATVKRFFKEKDHYRLQPENDTMDPIITDHVEILGKVIGLIRMM